MQVQLLNDKIDREQSFKSAQASPVGTNIQPALGGRAKEAFLARGLRSRYDISRSTTRWFYREVVTGYSISIVSGLHSIVGNTYENN